MAVANLAPNCIQYDTTPKCTACAPPYYLYQATGQPPSCITSTGCARLETITNNARCGLCSDSSYLLWDGKCLTPDSKNCVYNLQKNATSAGFQMTTGYPCQVCATGYYYEADNGRRTVVCNTVALGTAPNCLLYYTPTASMTDAYCSRCYRGFRRIVGNKVNCTFQEVFYNKNITTTCVTTVGNTNSCSQTYFMGSYSNDLITTIFYYDIPAANLPLIFPLGTWANMPTVASLSFSTITGAGSAPTYCAQFSADLTKCLSCKFYYSPVWVATSWDTLKASAVTHSKFTYGYRQLTKDYDELTHTTSSPPVTHCRTANAQTWNTKLFPTNLVATSNDPNFFNYATNVRTWYINGVTIHQCIWAANLTLWTMASPALTLSANLTYVAANRPSNDWPADWGTFTTAANLLSTWSAAKLKLLNTTCTAPADDNSTASSAAPDNCVLFQNNTDYISEYQDRMYLSCARCSPGYTLATTWYNAALSVLVTAGNVTNSFTWIVNTCVSTVSISPSFMQISDCYHYNISNQGNRLYYTCQSCSSGFVPAKTTQPFQCSTTDTYSDITRTDNCRSDYTCSNYLLCKRNCPVCPANTYCNEATGTCDTTICTVCPDAANPRCRFATAGCPVETYCDNGSCVPVCSCQNGEVCTIKTGFKCSPMMVGPYATFDLRERIADNNVVVARTATVPTSESTAALSGCGNGNLAENEYCAKLSQCPVCPRNSYCRLRIDTVGSPSSPYKYECAYHPICLTCTGTTWCQSTFDYLLGKSTVTGCGPSPQWTYPWTAASCPDCWNCWNTLTDEVCVNGTNVRKLSEVCYWSQSNTVPVYCPAGKDCYGGRCLATGTVMGTTYINCNCAANQICVNYVCYAVQCPLCPPGTMCNVTRWTTSGTTYHAFGCVRSLFCDQCGANEHCHSTYVYSTTIAASPNITIFDSCRPYAQVAIPNPDPTLTPCSGRLLSYL